jgi:S-adenosylmethionine hydrolase
VSWEKWIPAYIRNKVKKQGIIIDELGNVIKNVNEEEPDDILNVNSQILHDKPNDVKTQSKEQKQYTPIEKYKPTGNLVYHQDMFEKLEKKVSF